MDHLCGCVIFYSGIIIGIHLTTLLVWAFGKFIEKTILPIKEENKPTISLFRLCYSCMEEAR